MVDMRGRGLLVAALVLLAAGGSVAPARAVDSDGSPPTLVTPDRASWLVGSQLDLDLDYCPGLNLTVARQTFAWTATDDSGSVASSVVVVPWAAEPYELSLDPSATSATVRTDDWQNDCGGPRGFPDTYEVTATDPAATQPSAEPEPRADAGRSRHDQCEPQPATSFSPHVASRPRQRLGATGSSTSRIRLSGRVNPPTTAGVRPPVAARKRHERS